MDANGKINHSGTSKSRFFGIVTYLSDTERIVKMIQAKQSSIRAYAIIKHDKDEADPHCHIVLRTHGSWTCANVCKWFKDDETGQNCFAEFVHDRSGIIEYLTHENDPDKHHYSKEDIIDGGIDDILPKGDANDNTFEILELMMKGTPVRELVRLYGKDFLYHIRDYTTAVKMISVQEGSETATYLNVI